MFIAKDNTISSREYQNLQKLTYGKWSAVL